MRGTRFWEQFGEVTVQRLVRPERGSSLLIVGDTSTDPGLLEACFAAGVRSGAEATLLVIPRRSRGAGGNLGPSAAGAIKGARNILVLGGNIVRDPATVEAVAKGTRILSTNVNGIEDYCLRAVLDIDIDKMDRNSQRVKELWDAAEWVHVTSPQGTDLKMRHKPRKAVIGDGALDYDSEIDFFPGAQVNIAPVEESINGVVIVDASDAVNGIVQTPYAMHLKEGVIVKVEGGQEADAVRNYLENRKNPKGEPDPIVYHMCHSSLGMNPAAGISGNLLEDERKLAALDLGFGGGYPALGGKVGHSQNHWDIMMATPTIFVDGKEMSGGGKLNPEMGFEQ